MKKILSFLFAIHLSTVSFAQTKIIACEEIQAQSHDQLWGFIDPQGGEIIKNQYIDAHSFTSDGVALVNDQKLRRWKLINKANEEIKLPYNDFNWRPEPVPIPWTVQKKIEYGVLQFIVKKKFGVANIKGQVIIEPIYNEMSDFVEGKAIAELDGKFYILSVDGSKSEVQGSPNFVNSVKEGYAPFRNASKLFGFVNEKGEVVIQPKFKKVGYFCNGLAWARTIEGLIGFIDTKGEWIVKPEYNAVTDFDSVDGIAKAKRGEEWVFLKKSGETFNVEGSIDMGEFSEGRAWVRVGDKIGFIDTKGSWIVKPTYSKVKNFEDGYALVRSEDKWGIITKDGRSIVEPSYVNIKGDLSDGFRGVQVGEKWGFINEQGVLVIEPQYLNIRAFKNGFAAVRIGDFWGLIDKTGKLVIEAKYHRLKDVEIIK